MQVYRFLKKANLLVQTHSSEILQNQRCPVSRCPVPGCCKERHHQNKWGSWESLLPLGSLLLGSPLVWTKICKQLPESLGKTLRAGPGEEMASSNRKHNKATQHVGSLTSMSLGQTWFCWFSLHSLSPRVVSPCI